MKKPPATSNVIPNIEEHLFEPVPIDHQTREAMAEIAQFTLENVATIGEEHFQAMILPLLLPTAPDTKPADRRAWLDAAGDYMRPLQVVDGAGEKLFDVPPLLDTLPTAYGRTGEHSMGEILGRNQLREKISPPVAAMELRSSLETFIPDGAYGFRMQERYGHIFARYGINPYDAAPSAQSTAAGVESTGGEASPLDDDDFHIT